jgi:phosphatase NudJ
MDKRIAFSTHGFSVVVIRHPKTQKWLAVNETRGRGWWLPAGHVDRGQTFRDAALAEAQEEAGISIKFDGLLAIEHTLQSSSDARMRVVFLASPSDPEAPIKTVPDAESLGAEWMTVEQLKDLAALPPPKGLRGKELLRWAMYIEAGGPIAPIEMLQDEDDGPCEALSKLQTKGLDRQHALVNRDEAPLLLAARHGDVAALKSALENGANIEVVTMPKHWSALHLAVDVQAEEVVRTLLLAQANANATTHKGRTPLHMACDRPSVAITRLLLLAGARPEATDQDGTSCLQWCTDEKHCQLLNLCSE